MAGRGLNHAGELSLLFPFLLLIEEFPIDGRVLFLPPMVSLFWKKYTCQHADASKGLPSRIQGFINFFLHHYPLDFLSLTFYFMSFLYNSSKRKLTSTPMKKSYTRGSTALHGWFVREKEGIMRSLVHLDFTIRGGGFWVNHSSWNSYEIKV